MSEHMKDGKSNLHLTPPHAVHTEFTITFLYLL